MLKCRYILLSEDILERSRLVSVPSQLTHKYTLITRQQCPNYYYYHYTGLTASLPGQLG